MIKPCKLPCIQCIHRLSIFIGITSQIIKISVILFSSITNIISITNGYDINTLRQIVSALSNQLDNNFILLANINDDNSVNYIAKSNSNRVNCGDIVKDLAVRSSGNGGGNKSFAQGGGTDGSITSKLLENVKEIIRNL